MIRKRKCAKCGKRINNQFRFCPHCGFGDRDFDDGDWGMLGKDDFFAEGNIQTGFGFDNLFNTLMKNITKQMNNSLSEKSPAKTNGISISISSSGNNAPKIRVNGAPAKKIVKKIPGQFSEEDAKRFSKLEKQEPKTSIKRLSNRLIYEIEMPEVQSLKDISIIRLESSIEIRAIGKTKAYFKKISLNMPIINYIFDEEKLVLEFAVKG